MATSSFYQDNLFRAYPFEHKDGSKLNTRYIVAAKVICSYASPFTSFPRVYLKDINVRTASHQLTFVCTDGQTSTNVSLDVPLTTPVGQPVFSKVQADTVVQCVFGDYSATATSSNQKYYLEPPCVLWLRHRGIAKIVVGNENRARLPATSLPPNAASYVKDAYLNPGFWKQDQEIYQEPLLFSEGYNCELIPSISDNAIRFLPKVNAGMGPVEEFAMLGTTRVNSRDVIEEQIKDSRIRPDGLPSNDLVLYSFCGATGTEIVHVPTQTVSMRNDLDASTVSISMTSLNGTEC